MLKKFRRSLLVHTVHADSCPTSPRSESPDSQEPIITPASPRLDSPRAPGSPKNSPKGSPRIDSPRSSKSSPRVDSPRANSPRMDSPRVDSPRVDSSKESSRPTSPRINHTGESIGGDSPRSPEPQRWKPYGEESQNKPAQNESTQNESTQNEPVQEEPNREKFNLLLDKSPESSKPGYGQALMRIREGLSNESNLLRTESRKIHPTEILIEAVKSKNMDSIKNCLKDYRVDITPALLVSAASGELEIMKTLLNHSAGIRVDTGINIHKQKKEQESIDEDQRKQYLTLLSSGRKRSGIYGHRAPSFSAAARNGHMNIIQYLISLNVHFIENVIESGLIEAIIAKQTEVVQLLIEYKEQYNFLNMVKLSAERDNLTALKLFYFIDPGITDTALGIAASCGHFQMTKFLIENCNGYPVIALSKAMKSGQAEIVIYLYRYHKDKLDM